MQPSHDVYTQICRVEMERVPSLYGLLVTVVTTMTRVLQMAMCRASILLQ